MGKACTDLAGGLRGILLVRLELRAGQTLFLQQLIEFTHQIGHFMGSYSCEASSATTRQGRAGVI
jgi:hypothetical protein